MPRIILRVCFSVSNDSGDEDFVAWFALAHAAQNSVRCILLLQLFRCKVFLVACKRSGRVCRWRDVHKLLHFLVPMHSRLSFPGLPDC